MITKIASAIIIILMILGLIAHYFIPKHESSENFELIKEIGGNYAYYKDLNADNICYLSLVDAYAFSVVIEYTYVPCDQIK